MKQLHAYLLRTCLCEHVITYAGRAGSTIQLAVTYSSTVPHSRCAMVCTSFSVNLSVRHQTHPQISNGSSLFVMPST
jgi:hypothetical protein